MSDRSSSTTAVLIGRLALAAVAAAAALGSLAAARRGAPPPVPGQATPAVYVCPMHPQVTARSPGDCPICRMALVPAAAAPAGTGEPTTLTLPADKQLHGWDAVSHAKPFESSFEMRAPAAADDGATGVALYHLDESALIAAGEEGLFSPSSGPRAGAPLGVPVRVLPGPRPRWDEATVLVRFAVEPGTPLVPNETGLLKLATRQRTDLVVGEEAILDSPAGPYVLVTADRRTLSKRPVQVGTRLYGQAAIVSGLRRGEGVVARHTFVLDVQRRSPRGVGL